MNVQMQLPHTLPYMTKVMTCTFSLRLQTTHLYWLAAKDTDENPSGRGAITPRLSALSDLKAKLKKEMCKSHRLGSAKTDTGYYNYRKDLRPLVNKQATNAFWNKSNLKFYEERNVMRYHTGTIFNQKHAYRYAFSPNANCPISAEVESPTRKY